MSSTEIYLNKLAITYNNISSYLSREFQDLLAKFESMAVVLGKPKPPEFRDLEQLEADYSPFQYYDETSDSYLDEYLRDKRFRQGSDPPLLIKLLEDIGRGFDGAAKILHQAITQSLVYKHHPECIHIIVPQSTNQDAISLESAPAEEQGLTAAQKLLFIRLLQIEGLFPKKPANTDDAPELRAIALLTGISYENQIKGGNGANTKVNLLLDHRSRRNMTVEQAKPKLKDLDAVEKVARLLNVQSVISVIDKYRKELQPSTGS